MKPEDQLPNLIALVADRDIQETLTRLFHRTEALGFSRFPFQITRHPGRDSGCRADAANFLRQFLHSHRHSLVVFDRKGCSSTSSREEIERGVESDLYRNGWERRARAVVIDPELEHWVWSGSSVVSSALGWEQGHDALRSWLSKKGLWDDGPPKPADPKAAMIHALQGAPRPNRRRRSARVFGEIAAGAPLGSCKDPAFEKLKATLREWFPDPGPSSRKLRGRHA